MDKKKEVENQVRETITLSDDDLEAMYRDYQARARKKEEKNASVV